MYLRGTIIARKQSGAGFQIPGLGFLLSFGELSLLRDYITTVLSVLSTVICELSLLCRLAQTNGGGFVNFYYNFVQLCNKIGKSPSRVIVEVGGTKSAITRWKNGGEPTDATAQKIANYFGVPIEELKGTAAEEQKKPAGQKADRLQDAGYYELTPENRAMIDALIDSLLKSQSGE